MKVGAGELEASRKLISRSEVWFHSFQDVNSNELKDKAARLTLRVQVGGRCFSGLVQTDAVRKIIDLSDFSFVELMKWVDTRANAADSSFAGGRR